MINLKDISAQIQIKKQMEALRDKITDSKNGKTAAKMDVFDSQRCENRLQYQ
jgi:hypothetical protein